MATNIERLGRSSYLLVTTFRRDGTPVPTPVWVARDGDELIIWSQTTAGKIKRIRNSGAVELADCDFRGRAKGETVKGTARILDGEATERGRRLLKKKYGLTGHVTISASKLRRGPTGTVCVAITLS